MPRNYENRSLQQAEIPLSNTQTAQRIGIRAQTLCDCRLSLQWLQLRALNVMFAFNRLPVPLLSALMSFAGYRAGGDYGKHH